MSRALRILVFPAHEAYAQSLVGLLLWAVGVAIVQPGWSPALLMFGPLVLYPLLFEMMEEHNLRRVALLAFLPALASYAFDQGTVAGALALPWLGFTLVLAGHRLLKEVRGRQYGIVLIKGYLIVGACWLVLARLGQRPLEFSHAIVHATAVHFHYAGFVLPIVALQWLRSAPGRRGAILISALLLGVPLVAAGITLSALAIDWVELLAVCFFVAACIWFALEQVRFALALRRGQGRILLIVSSVSLLTAMSLALLYALGNHWKQDWLDINWMLRTHGPIQVFGFALPGVVAWRFLNEPRP
jgi:YndJ-like protein